MKKLLIFRVLIFVFLFYSFVFAFSSFFDITIEDVRSVITSFGLLAPIVYTVILIFGLTIPFNPISDFLVVNVAALIFHPIVSIVFTFIAHSIALIVNYNVGKRYGKGVVNKVFDKRNSLYIEKFVRKLTLRKLFILRFFLPTSNVVGVEILSYLSGYDGLPFKKFFLASIIPWTILNIAYFTATYFLREKSLSLYFLPAVIMIGLPLALYIIYRKLSSR